MIIALNIIAESLVNEFVLGGDRRFIDKTRNCFFDTVLNESFYCTIFKKRGEVL